MSHLTNIEFVSITGIKVFIDGTMLVNINGLYTVIKAYIIYLDVTGQRDDRLICFLGFLAGGSKARLLW